MEATESFWINPVINFGEIQRNRIKTFVYQGLPTMPAINKVTVGCGCTTAKWFPESRELKVVYKSGEFPKQVVGNTMDIVKYIVIRYANGTEEILYLKGIKTR